jgi:poly(A) polymerase
MDLSRHLNHQVFRVIAEVSAREQVETYVIGGFVRDVLLHGKSAPLRDIDIVVIGSGIGLAEKVRSTLPGEVPFTVYRNFGTAMLRWNDTEIEFVGARKESYRRDSRKPIVENGTLEDDQKRRDFTINALAISLNPGNFGMLLDPFDGVRHLKEKVITTPLDPGQTFSDDPLRMLRGIRFAARLGFRIEPLTLDAMARNRERISIVSQERITDEINKILLTPGPGCLRSFFPNCT